MRVTKNQLSELQTVIADELLKRGFTAKIIQFEEVQAKNGTKIELTTESFQTVPVLFKEVAIGNFNSELREEQVVIQDKPVKVLKFWMSVNVFYQHFGSGSNGCNLFSIWATLYENRALEIKIK